MNAWKGRRSDILALRAVIWMLSAPLVLVLTLSGAAAATPEEPSAGGPPWFEAYRQAVVHADLEEWGAVEESIRTAIALNPRPQRNVRIYGMWHTSYTPWFYLGLSEYRQGRYEEAMISFRKEEEAGVIQHDPVAYLRMRKLIASGQAGPPPPPSQPSPKPVGAPDAAPRSLPASAEPGPVIAGLQAFFRGDYDGSIADFQEAMKQGKGSDLTLHLYLGMAYAGKASSDKGHRTIWENLAYLEFQRVHELDPGYRLSPGIFSEEMMDLFDRAGASR